MRIYRISWSNSTTYSQKISIQVGNPKIIAKNLKKIVYNFRQNDILNNGWAPLSPIHHKVLLKIYQCLYLRAL